MPDNRAVMEYLPVRDVIPLSRLVRHG